ncbi:hypothetical protein [Moraxella cuniculi]|uniref:hypothetical protein n=1 Tax=Moraxella cuniculi TaxID=34061 RepID=UPI000F84118A|nr:hypothetical protein [Moraxella cuniculi]
MINFGLVDSYYGGFGNGSKAQKSQGVLWHLKVVRNPKPAIGYHHTLSGRNFRAWQQNYDKNATCNKLAQMPHKIVSHHCVLLPCQSGAVSQKSCLN